MKKINCIFCDLDKNKNSRIISKLNSIIEGYQKDSKDKRAEKHFYALKQRLKKGQTLTKKMNENLSWIVEGLNESLSVKQK